MPTFTHTLLARYADCVSDDTEYDEVPPGWRALVALLLRDLAEALAAFPGHMVEIRQIKEKFGTLRVYLSYGGGERGLAVHRILHPIIVAPEAKSAGTCQSCGRPGRLRRGPGLGNALRWACAKARAVRPR